LLRHCNAVIHELFKLETDKVKVEVQKRREKGDFSDVEDINHDDDSVEASEWHCQARALGFHK